MLTVKSGFLLGISCVSGISAVGSVFELASGQPDFGQLTTGIILAASIPIAILSFYLAVQDAKAGQ